MAPTSTSTVSKQVQINHSGYMRLLAALRFKHEESMISNKTSGLRTNTFQADIPHLETIALCMVTGSPGDVVASAFWRNTKDSLSIVLAKNDACTLEDGRDAQTFLQILRDPRTQDVQDLLPFLVSRGETKLQVCLNKVTNLTKEVNRGGLLKSAIETYCKQKDRGSLQSELPSKRGRDLLDLLKSKDVKVSDLALETVLKDIVNTLAKGLSSKDSNFRPAFKLYATSAAALTSSRFFTALVTGSTSVNPVDLEKDGDSIFSKFWRNLDKMRPYLRIVDLIEFIQQFEDVRITWVSGSTAEPKHVKDMSNKIAIPSVLDVALNLARESDIRNNEVVKDLTIQKLETLFRKENPFWIDKRTGTSKFTQTTHIIPKLHAEIQIILHFKSYKIGNAQGQRWPIGCSKRSCLQCKLAMGVIDDGAWMTAGAHGWPYETAALIGSKAAWDEHVRKEIKSYAIKGVKQLLGLEDSRPSHAKKNSEEYTTASSKSGSGSESSDSNQELSKVPKLTRK